MSDILTGSFFIFLFKLWHSGCNQKWIITSFTLYVHFSEAKQTPISLLTFLKIHLSNCWKDPGIAWKVLLMILKHLLQFLGGFLAAERFTITLRKSNVNSNIEGEAVLQWGEVAYKPGQSLRRCYFSCAIAWGPRLEMGLWNVDRKYDVILESRHEKDIKALMRYSIQMIRI